MTHLRPVVRPGSPLLRRDAAHLQIGTTPGVVVPDRPGLLAFLRLLDGVRDLDRLRRVARAEVPELDDDPADVLRPLMAAGAVVDASSLRPRPLRLTASMHVDPGAHRFGAIVRDALTDVGVRGLDSPDPDLLVVVSCGEPGRSVFSAAAQQSIAHLPVVLDDDRVRVGPLVRPGLTPCLGCLDLTRADWDPAWPVLLHQLGRPGHLAAPPVVDPVVLHVAAAEIAAEVRALATGRPVRTSGAVVAIGPTHGDRDSWPVAFHHACGCALLPAA
jgi:bacteriocin biosynthesis cyclodehydratase domain-containing protein